MLKGEAALKALETEETVWGTRGKVDPRKGDVAPPRKGDAAGTAYAPPRDWEKFANGLMGPKTLLSGVCLLPTSRDDATGQPAGNRRNAMCACLPPLPAPPGPCPSPAWPKHSTDTRKRASR